MYVQETPVSMIRPLLSELNPPPQNIDSDEESFVFSSAAAYRSVERYKFCSHNKLLLITISFENCLK